MPRVDTGVSDDAWRSLWLYDVTNDAVRRLSPAGLNTWEAVWLGLVRRCSPSPHPAPTRAAWYTAVLSRIDLDGTTTLWSSDVQLGLPAG